MAQREIGNSSSNVARFRKTAAMDIDTSWPLKGKPSLTILALVQAT
jgi:hypothetical protein